MHPRSSRIQPARAMQARSRPGVGGLRLGRDQGQASGRQPFGMLGRDEAGGRARRRKVVRIPPIGEEAHGPLCGFGQWRHEPDRRIARGAVGRARLDRQAASISLPVALGVRADGQKALPAIKDMGGKAKPK